MDGLTHTKQLLSLLCIVYFPKNIFLHFNSFENIMENGKYDPQGKMFNFLQYLKQILHFKGV